MRDDFGLQMVKVSRQELIERIVANKETHRAEFEKAWEGYRKLMTDELEKMLADAKAGKRIKRHIEVPEPQDHTDDYDTVIQMLTMSVDDQVFISQGEFAQYVLDKWNWKGQFTATNAFYAAAAG
jgi:hypothetical protein